MLLAPKSTDYPYYAQFGWIGARCPERCQSVWRQEGTGGLSPGHPVTLSWDNGHGLVFTRVITVDEQYMFSVTDSVTNKGGQTETLYPYADVVREGTPKQQTSWVLHQGFVGVANGSETDANYSDFKDEGAAPKTFASTGGWVGITDKYWMAAVIPPRERLITANIWAPRSAATPRPIRPITVFPRASFPPTARRKSPIDCSPAPRWWTYCAATNAHQGIARFDNAVDWGWFWFLTQPLFWLLDIFSKIYRQFRPRHPDADGGGQDRCSSRSPTNPSNP